MQPMSHFRKRKRRLKKRLASLDNSQLLPVRELQSELAKNNHFQIRSSSRPETPPFRDHRLCWAHSCGPAAT